VAEKKHIRVTIYGRYGELFEIQYVNDETTKVVKRIRSRLFMRRTIGIRKRYSFYNYRVEREVSLPYRMNTKKMLNGVWEGLRSFCGFKKFPQNLIQLNKQFDEFLNPDQLPTKVRQ